VIFSEITEKQCVKERHRRCKAKIRLVQRIARPWWSFLFSKPAHRLRKVCRARWQNSDVDRNPLETRGLSVHTSPLGRTVGGEEGDKAFYAV